jgi:hypothetical protein
MMRIKAMLSGLILLVGMLVLGALGIAHYGSVKYEAGYAAAVADGEARRQADAEIARQTETDLRNRLRAQDIAAHRKEQEHASTLQAAQRRVIAGADRLRCPARPVPASPAPEHRPAAGGTEADEAGPDLVPQAAADVLGYGSAIAGLVRRYERLEQRFEECRALNAFP